MPTSWCVVALAHETSLMVHGLASPSREKQLRERLVRMSQRHRAKVAKLEEANHKLQQLVKGFREEIRRLRG
jgi:hypothetical protein